MSLLDRRHHVLCLLFIVYTHWVCDRDCIVLWHLGMPRISIHFLFSKQLQQELNFKIYNIFFSMANKLSAVTLNTSKCFKMPTSSYWKHDTPNHNYRTRESPFIIKSKGMLMSHLCFASMQRNENSCKRMGIGKLLMPIKIFSSKFSSLTSHKVEHSDRIHRRNQFCTFLIN